MKEGVALVGEGLSPYEGDLFHQVGVQPNTCLSTCFCFLTQSPLVLGLFHWLVPLGETAVGILFVVSGEDSSPAAIFDQTIHLYCSSVWIC